jgi:TonB family protein
MAEMNNDIEKYLRGELTPAEMHALEQRALGDPFLAEALEGAEGADAEQFVTDIEAIQNSIHEKTRKRLPKTITLNGWPMYAGIAAGLLLLAVSTYVIFISIQQERQMKLAKLEQSLQQELLAFDERTTDSLDVIFPQSEQNATAEKLHGEVRKTKRKKIRENEVTQSAPFSTSIAQNEAAPVKEDAVVVDMTEAEVRKDADIAEESKQENVAEAPMLAKESTDDQKPDSKRNGKATSAKYKSSSRSAEIQNYRNTPSGSTSNIITGRVTDESGAGLPGVNVNLKGTTIGTVTDAEGNFQLNTLANDQTLTVAFIGYNTEEVNPEAGKPISITLTPNTTALSEVVVVGYGSSGTSDAEPEIFNMAEPSGGKRAFRKYLEENIQYPEQAVANKIEGRVTVQFTINTDGLLSDFKVIKGIGFGCDEELIRLIKAGPSWKPSQKNNFPVQDQVKVRLKFTLPER